MEAHGRVIPEPPRTRRRPLAPGLPGGVGLRAERTDGAAPITDGAEHCVIEARDRFYRRMLAYADVLAALIALTLALDVLGDDMLKPLSLLALPLIVLAGKLQGLYDRDELLLRKTTIDEAPQLFQLATLYTLVLWVAGDVLLDGSLGREQALVLWGSFFLFALGGRSVARIAARRTSPVERCMFIGDAGAYARLRSKLDQSDVRAELVGRLSLQRIARAGARNAGAQELHDLMGWADVHRVIIEPQTLPPDEMLDLVRAAKSVGVRVSLLPRVLDVVGTSVVFDDLHGMTLLGVRRFGLTRSSLFVKRAFDLAVAGVGLIAVAPLMAAIALIIKVRTAPGPVFFRQTRIGRDGKPFQIIKFRTMVADAEERKHELRDLNECPEGGLFKIEDDPRVTCIGRVLRRTSLDELPQLLNVLKGDMSLVGPRPLVADEDEQVTGYDRRRLHLTPGMTGPWQILGSSRVPLPEMLKIDYLYVAGWSLWSDLKILLRTVPYMLARRGM